MRQGFRTIALHSALGLSLLSGATLFAQDAPQDQGAAPMQQGGPRGPMTPEREMDHLTKALQLTSDQQAQIKPILQDRHDQMMQMHQDASMSRPDRMAKMKALDDSSNAKLEGVLTDQQKPKYEKMMAKRKEHMQEMRANRQNGGAPPAEGGSSQPQ